MEPVQDIDGATPPVETPVSVLSRYRSYDEYNKCDFLLHCLVFEALVHPDISSEVVFQYNQVSSFKKLPGQVYLMMVLQVCHASFASKMDDTASSVAALDFTNVSGGEISQFTNESQCLVKIIKGGYSLPCQLGSTILRKVCATQSDYFNRTIFNLLDKTLEMEKSH